MTKKELLERINAQETELIRLRAENAVLREYIGLEQKESRGGAVVIPFTKK